ENEAKVITDGAEDDVGGIAGATFEVTAAEVTFCFHMSNLRLDRGASSELAFDAAEHAAFLPAGATIRRTNNRVRKKQSSAIIAVDVRRFGHVINKDEVFGTHRGGRPSFLAVFQRARMIASGNLALAATSFSFVNSCSQ